MTVKVTKTQIAIDILKANLGKPMSEVIPLIMEGCDLSEKNARVCYALRVKADPTLGTIEKRERKVTEKVPAKIKSPKLVAAVVGSLEDKPKITNMTVEEIADKTAKRSKKKSKATGPAATSSATGVENFDPEEARAYVDAVTDDIENFRAPSELSMEEVKALI